MSEKEKLRAASLVVTNDADGPTIFVDLDDPKTVQSVERHAGLSLVRLAIVRGGHKQFVFVSLTARGFELSDKYGLMVQLEATRAGQPAREESMNVNPVREGAKLEG